MCIIVCWNVWPIRKHFEGWERKEVTRWSDKNNIWSMLTTKVKTFHCGILTANESTTSAPFYYTSYMSQLLARIIVFTRRTIWLSAWLLHIPPILNVKQVWCGAFIVNNLAQTSGSANQRASTFSSYEDLLFLQLPGRLRLKRTPLEQTGTPSFSEQLPLICVW